MSRPIKALARHSLVYGIGSVLSAAGSFLLIPLYTHLLPTADYGVVELLNRIADVTILIIFLGCRQAFSRLYYDQDDEAGRKVVTGTMVLFVLGSSVIVLSLLLPFRGLIVDLLFNGAASVALLSLVLAWIPLEMVVNVGMGFLQARMLSVLFVTVSVLRLTAYISLNVGFLYVARWGVKGVFVAQLLATGAVATAFLVFFGRWTRFKASWPMLRQLVKFGVPYLPAAFFMYLVTSSDRYFLSANGMLGQLGIYALSYKIGMSLTMLTLEPVLRAWVPFMYTHYQQDDGPAVIGRVLTLFTLVAISAGLLIAVSAPVLIPLISDRAYHDAWRFVPLLCITAAFYGMTHLADAGILIAKKTVHKPVIFGTAAAVAVAGNALLIPRLGVLGAALTTNLSYAVLLFMTHMYSRRYYRIAVEQQRLGLIFAGAVLAYAVSAVIIHNASDTLPGRILSLAGLVIYPAFLWSTGFFTDGEKAFLFRILRFGRQPAGG